MLLFYLIALIPVFIGGILWINSKEIVWWEWLISSTVALLTSALIHAFALYGMTADVETWSGTIEKAVRYPKWVEQYQEAVYRTETYTDFNGKTSTRRVLSHYETKYRDHPERYEVALYFGSKSFNKNISKSFFQEIKNNWGGEECIKKQKGSRPGFYSGDKNDYIATDMVGYVYPVNQTYRFENKIKAAPSVYSFAPVPESIRVFEYPQNKNWKQSNRLLGKAKDSVSILEWDRMNSRLGPIKKVNVILIGFDSTDSQIGQYQEAKWIGGKKNDLVLCYGKKDNKICWTYVFGWTEKEIVKRNLETILLKNEINDDIISVIEKEIVENYKIKDWEKFDYINVEPEPFYYYVLIIIMVVTQSIIILCSYKNKQKK